MIEPDGEQQSLMVLNDTKQPTEPNHATSSSIFSSIPYQQQNNEEEPYYPDPRIAWVRDALHLPKKTSFDVVNKIRATIDDKRKRITEGSETLDINDVWAAYLHPEYLEEHGDTLETRNHLLHGFMRFKLWEYMDQFHVEYREDEEEALQTLSTKVDTSYIKQQIEWYGNGLKAEDEKHPTIIDLLRIDAMKDVKKVIEQYHNLDEINQKYAQEVIDDAHHFPQGTTISIDKESITTCVLPDGTVMRLDPSHLRLKDQLFTLKLVTPTHEEKNLVFPKQLKSTDTEKPEFDQSIAMSLNILRFSHLYLWYLDRIKKKYDAANPPVSMQIETKDVAQSGYERGSLYDLREFRYLLERVYKDDLQKQDQHA